MMQGKCGAVVILLFVLCVGQALGQERGKSALPGIDTLPMDAIWLSNERMKNLFIVTDAFNEGVLDYDDIDINRLLQHNRSVQKAACDGYITQCDYTIPLTTPFTFLAKYPLPKNQEVLMEWLLHEINRIRGKIVTSSSGHGGPFPASITTQPFINVNGADNVRDDNFFYFADAVYDRKRDVFVKNDQILSRSKAGWLDKIRDAVEDQRIIYASTYILDGQENITPVTTGCLGVEESCVWLPEDMHNGSATSYQSPRLGAALASLLAVFPEYDVFDMAALTNSCALPHPNLAGGGIVNIPCMIETICEETGNQSSACTVEQRPLKPVTVDTSIGWLENPTARPGMIYAERSGISAISGWVCDAEEIIIELNGTPYEAGYGTIRTDTAGTCGDTDNGFSLLWNWNLLGDGLHTVEAFADGQKFASTMVKVTTLGEEMVHGISTEYYLPLSVFRPSFTSNTEVLQWNHSLQNFVIVPKDIGGFDSLQKGYNHVAGLKGFLGNPAQGSNQSGLAAISGWVCEAEEIIIALNGEPFRAGYGTTRPDTIDDCGDIDNGFSLLWNWNRLGDGLHTVEAFADGVKFASTQVRVTTLGKEFLQGADGYFSTQMASIFGGVFADGDKRIALKWVESLQNFVITGFGKTSAQ